MAVDLGKLLEALARAVARGLLPIALAEASLAVAICANERENDPIKHGYGTFAEKSHIWNDLLRQYVERYEAKQARTECQICRAIKPLLVQRVRWGRVMATAHDINADAGNWLGETEVEAIVRREAYYALPPPPFRGVRSHG